MKNYNSKSPIVFTTNQKFEKYQVLLKSKTVTIVKNFILIAIVLFSFKTANAQLNITWDADVDPTTYDGNNDNVNDWVVRGCSGSNCFNSSNLSGGIWMGGQMLDSRPTNDFSSAFDVHMRWRADVGTTDKWDAMFWVNRVPSNNSSGYAAVYFSILNDGINQTLNVYHKPNNTETLLASYTGLGLDFLDTKFEFNSTNQLTVTINTTTHSTLTFATTTTQNNDRWATLLGDKIQLDYFGFSPKNTSTTKIKLVDGNNAALANYKAKYRYLCGSSNSNWADFTTDGNGNATLSVSCTNNNWNGKITLWINNTSKTQTVSTNSEFKLSKVNVNLKDCDGKGLSGGVVTQYHTSTGIGTYWNSSGTTPSNGTVSFYAFAGQSVRVRMLYNDGLVEVSSTTVVSPETDID